MERAVHLNMQQGQKWNVAKFVVFNSEFPFVLRMDWVWMMLMRWCVKVHTWCILICIRGWNLFGIMLSLVILKSLRCWFHFLLKILFYESWNVSSSTNFGLIIHFEFTFIRYFQLFQVSPQTNAQSHIASSKEMETSVLKTMHFATFHFWLCPIFRSTAHSMIT